MSIYNILAVGTGGFIGSVCRYLSVIWIDKRLNTVFPYGTLAVNVVGSMVLGIIVGMTLKSDSMNGNWKLFLTTGFCGGFTTFSAFALENVNLVEQKMIGPAMGYSLASLLFGFLAVTVGILIGRIAG